eukprot:6214833-Pleurochrysis_carterae.AAC.4
MARGPSPSTRGVNMEIYTADTRVVALTVRPWTRRPYAAQAQAMSEGVRTHCEDPTAYAGAADFALTRPTQVRLVQVSACGVALT